MILFQEENGSLRKRLQAAEQSLIKKESEDSKVATKLVDMEMTLHMADQKVGNMRKPTVGMRALACVKEFPRVSILKSERQHLFRKLLIS